MVLDLNSDLRKIIKQSTEDIISQYTKPEKVTKEGVNIGRSNNRGLSK